MEAKELEKRIENLLDLVNNAKSISLSRRYCISLLGLTKIYNKMTGSNYELEEVFGQRMLKESYYDSVRKEIGGASGILLDMSETILQTKANMPYEFGTLFPSKTYGRKYLDEILESFLASLGDRVYKLYKEAKADGRIFYNQTFSEGETVFDYESKKSAIFLPQDRETLEYFLTVAHEMGHVYEYDFTKCSRKPLMAAKFRPTGEVFPMLFELISVDYLRKIHIDPVDVETLEEKRCVLLNQNAAHTMFAMSLPELYINYAHKVVILERDLPEALSLCDAIFDAYDVNYIERHINLEYAVAYMCGGLLGTICAHYYLQDKSFMDFLTRGFFDYETLSAREELMAFPYLDQELRDGKTWRKRLEQIKTNRY